MNKEKLSDLIVNIKNYPKSGIVFKDITPILSNNEAYKFSIDEMIKIIKNKYPEATHIVSPEARGFWFGCPIAVNGGYDFVPIRKPGKLPRETITANFELEYGTESLCIHKDSLKKGDVVVVVDDILATGGTLLAIKQLINEQEATLSGFVVLGKIKGLASESLEKENLDYVIEI